MRPFRTILCLLALAVSCSVSATILDVPGQHPTIQGAVAAAAPGDTVLVHNGIYSGGVTLRSRVTILGESREGVVVQGSSAGDGSGPMQAFLFDDFSGLPRGLAGAVVENLTIRGFQRGVTLLDNFGAAEPPPLGLTLRGLLVEDCNEGFFLLWNAMPSGALVEGNEIRRGGVGVVLTRAESVVRVTGNRIVGPFIGIQVGTYGGPVIDHNMISGAARSGIELGGLNSTATNNTVVGASTGISIVFDGARVTGNILAGNGQAVSVYYGAATFRYNVYWSNTETGRALDSTEVVGDPGFVGDGSYRLGPGSAAIDAGDPDAPYALEPPYNGRRSDAGAYGGTALATPSAPEVDIEVLASVPAAGIGAFAGVDVLVTNTGTTRLDLRTVRLEGADGAFAVVGSVPDAVPAGASDTLRVALVQQTQGTYSGTLVIETNDEDEPVVTIPVEARRVERLYVDAAAPGGDGSAWPAAYADLTAALRFTDEIAGRVSVWARGGTYRPTGDGRRSTFVVREGVALLGGFSGTADVRNPDIYLTVLSGDIGALGDATDNAYNVVTVRAVAEADSVVIDGVVVTGGMDDDGGFLDPNGGGLTGTDVMLVVRRSTFASNYGLGGGGLACDLCSVVVVDASFRHNRSSGYGGGLVVSRGPVVVSRSVFEGNVSEYGGGAAGLVSCSYDLSDVRFSDNTTGASGGVGIAGGGLFVQDGSGRIARATFERNRSTTGGGASVTTSGDTEIEDVVFDRNETLFGGGGISLAGGGDIRVAHARFVANTAGNGGGLQVDGTDPGTTRVAITDAVFEDNVGVIDGGAMRLSKSTVVVNGARFVRNRAASGGALSVYATGLYAADAEFLGNAAAGTGTQGLGGAVVTFGDGQLTAVNSTFVGNQAEGAGSVLMALSGTSTLDNVVVAANGLQALVAQTGAEFRADFWVFNAVAWPVSPPFFASLNAGAPGAGGTLTVNHALVQGGASGTAVLDADPLYVRSPSPGADGQWGTPDDDYGDLHVQSGSPAIDAGLASLLPFDTADLDADGNTFEPVPLALGGGARVRGAALDLGAYEADGPVASDDGVHPRRGLTVSGANPSRSRTTLSLTLDAPSETVVIGLYDVLGRRVAVLHDAPVGAGRLDLDVNVSSLAVGSYVVRADTGVGPLSARLTVAR